MAYLGTKPANQVIDSTLIADGTVTPSDLSTGKPVWDTTGNLGVGTNSPVSLGSGYGTVDVRGSSGGGYRWGSATNSSYTYSDSAGLVISTANALPVILSTNNTERMRIDSSGNAFFKGSYVSYNDTGYIRCDVPNWLTFQAGSNGYQWRNAGNNSTAQMTLDSSGRLLVNLTSLPTSSARLNIGFNNNSGTYGLNIYHTSSSYSDSAIVFYGHSNQTMGYIYSNGTSTQYGTSSDYRLKENIAPMTGALAKVSALKPVTYNWKSTGEASQGFIAHELQEVVPDAVYGEKDAVNEDGSIKAQGIDTSFLVATLTAAIQEQQAIINDLKTRIEALEQA